MQFSDTYFGRDRWRQQTRLNVLYRESQSNLSLDEKSEEFGGDIGLPQDNLF